MEEQVFTFYLRVDETIVAFGSEADMVNLAATYDCDYELVEEKEADPEEVREFLSRKDD